MLGDPDMVLLASVGPDWWPWPGGPGGGFRQPRARPQHLWRLERDGRLTRIRTPWGGRPAGPPEIRALPAWPSRKLLLVGTSAGWFSYGAEGLKRASLTLSG